MAICESEEKMYGGHRRKEKIPQVGSGRKESFKDAWWIEEHVHAHPGIIRYEMAVCGLHTLDYRECFGHCTRINKIELR